MQKAPRGPAATVAAEVGIPREALIRAVQAHRVIGERDERGWMIDRSSAAEFARQREASKADTSALAGAAT
jgi:hypothetical protein